MSHCVDSENSASPLGEGCLLLASRHIYDVDRSANCRFEKREVLMSVNVSIIYSAEATMMFYGGQFPWT